MQFHVTIKVLNTIVLDTDKQLRQVLGPQFESILKSGKVQSAGLLGGIRGAFFILEIGDPVELYEILGPEVLANCEIEAYPVVSFEKMGEVFQRWGQAGR